MTAELKTSRRDDTLVLRFYHPGQRNAPDNNVLAAAIETLSTAERDDAIRAIVLSGADGDFCGGIHAPKSVDNHMATLENVHSLIEALRSFPKPVIAAVEGAAINAGFSLALACDLIVAGQSSQFKITAAPGETWPVGGAGWFLQRVLAPQLITEIFLDAQPVSAVRLQAAGIVNHLVADGAALDQALNWADRLATSALPQFEQFKTWLNNASGSPLSAAFAMEKHTFLLGAKNLPAL